MSFPISALRLTLIFLLVQSNTTVPIPTILDWSDDSSNAIGSEYIIMEHAVGVQLHHKWPAMSREQKIACIRAISKNIQQIAAIKFPAYGSLYFADIRIDSASKVPVVERFCIGPIVELGIGIVMLAKPDTTFRSSPTGGRVSSRSLCCHDRVPYRCAQGLILRHTATALLILDFPDFLPSTSPSPKVHPFMDPLQHTLACSVSVAM